jgi:hypothetical protein
MERAHEELLQTALIQEREGFLIDAFRIGFRLKRLFPKDPRVQALVESLEKKRLEEFLESEVIPEADSFPKPPPTQGDWVPFAKRFYVEAPEALHEDLGLFFLALGDPAAAFCFFEKKHSVNLLYLKQWCLLNLNQFEEARAGLEGLGCTALEDYFLARSFELEGRCLEAKKAYQRAGNILDAPWRLEQLPEDRNPE